ncbi:hypothetical protein K1T71_009496 [Dendrolimus kikuchii]|uniref:Uncharacterized protein n=1 Tax=Dendrolimus kikuchii TaxID=765133 RepID=A0ACC1CV73_9NEOP|nr:hypothetical protein K1T71_009496 [Dendrolimus kikuchii]
MFIILLSLLFLIIILWFNTKWNKLKRHWADRNVPHCKPHPILGSLNFLLIENPGLFMKRLYNNFRSPYVGIWLFWRPGLVVNSPEIAQKILVKDTNVFKNRFLSCGKKDPTACNIFTVNNPLWTNIRKRLTPSFTSAKLRSFQNMMRTKSDNLKHRIQEELKNRRNIDLRNLFSDYTTDVIGETTLGLQCDATMTGRSALRDVTEGFQRYDIFRGLSFISIFFWPELCDTFGFTFFPKNATDSLAVLFKELVKRRGGYEQENLEHHDILDALIKIKREALKEGEDIDEEVLIAQAAILVQGGFDTTAAILTYTIYEIAHQLPLQERLYNELKDAKDAIDGGDLIANHLSELLNAVINETLRKYPQMGWLDRIAEQDYQIDENLTIKKGTVVYVNALGMHYDPDYFPDPDTFDPERFLPGIVENIKPYTFMPFGEGPRVCIGKRFAYQTMKFALSSVLLDFEVKPIPGAPKPHEIRIERRSMFLVPNDVMSVQFVPRF